ncbi:MAG: hypothetical protein IMY76_06210, partial [Chloroflexi bacterium]|nr:hypothetical protein [Chloroflexota bacterium]
MSKPTIISIIIFAAAWVLVGCNSPEVTIMPDLQYAALEIPSAEQPTL